MIGSSLPMRRTLLRHMIGVKPNLSCMFRWSGHDSPNYNMWATIIFSGTAALFVAMTFAALWHLRWVQRLPSLEVLATAERSASAPEGSIRCSVVIAARDEEARIASTIRHLLVQRGVEAEFIVVDDRSTDQTGGRIAGRLAWQMSRLPRRRQRGHGRLDSFHGCRLLVEARRDRASSSG